MPQIASLLAAVAVLSLAFLGCHARRRRRRRRCPRRRRPAGRRTRTGTPTSATCTSTLVSPLTPTCSDAHESRRRLPVRQGRGDRARERPPDSAPERGARLPGGHRPRLLPRLPAGDGYAGQRPVRVRHRHGTARTRLQRRLPEGDSGDGHGRVRRVARGRPKRRDPDRLAGDHRGRRGPQRPWHFTTFIGYEYTSSSDDRGNLHRNVIFKGSEAPMNPSPGPTPAIRRTSGAGWTTLRDQGIEGLAIPHNSNGSNGQMFRLETFRR